MKHFINLCFALLILSILPIIAQEQPPDIICEVFPEDNIWNARIDDLPVHPLSDNYEDEQEPKPPVDDFDDDDIPPRQKRL